MYLIKRVVILFFFLACGNIYCSAQFPDTLLAQKIVSLVKQDQFQKAIEELEVIQNHFVGSSPSREYLKLLIQVGLIFSEKGNYEVSQKYLFIALNLASQEGKEDLQAEALVEIAYLYYFLDQLEKGIEYAERALQLSTKLNLINVNGTAHNLLGILHTKAGHDRKIVTEHLQKAVDIHTQRRDAKAVAATLTNIALLLEREGQFEEALIKHKQSLAIEDSIGNDYGANWSYQMIGALLIKMKKFKEANQYLIQAEAISKKIKAREILLQTYRDRITYYIEIKKFEKVVEYLNRYNTLRDSVYNAGLSSKVTLLQQSFETRERDRQILKQQAEIEVQRKLFVVISIGVVIVLVLLIIYYRSYRKSLQLNKEITERTEEIQTQAEELTEANHALQELNVQIAEQREELQAQAEELIESNQMIGSLNEKLNSDIQIKNDELFKSNQELVKHNNELLQFSFTVSHNLRGPVARMLGLMNIISISKSNGEKDEYLKLLQRSTYELDTVLKDLNLIIDTRNQLLKVREKIAFQEEWNKTISLLHDYIKPEYSITANFIELPLVYSVRAMVQNVLYNLLSNSIRYCSPDRPLKIEVTTFKEADKNFIRIKDNGLGIDLGKYKDDVFKLYKRFHTHVTGKGLGLYLVKTQIESLGGTVEVESELNKGTVFTITLPFVSNIDEQILLENDSAKLFYDANINNTVIIWKRNITSHEYHKVFENVLQTLRTYNTPSWILDLTNQGKVSESDQVWFMKTVLPQAAECGLKRIGAIGFLDLRAQYFSNMQTKTKEMGIDLRVYETMDEAKNWMEKCLHVSNGTVE